MLTLEEKKARREARKQARLDAKQKAQIDFYRNQKPVSSMIISIEWVKSRIWNSNPHAIAQVKFKDMTLESSPDFNCSGCGYDKESTVIADCFNRYLRYRLFLIREKCPTLTLPEFQRDIPYGIYLDREIPYYGDGIGTNCYYRIAEFIGGKFEQVSSGKTYDVYSLTMRK